MSQHRKHRGYKTQRLVADYFKNEGWPHAHSVGAGAQGSDIVGLPFDVEVKARSGFNPKAAIAQIKARGSGLGFAVLRLNGQGENAAEYVAVIEFKELVNLLKQAGYNKIDKPEPVRCKACGGWKLEEMECQTCRHINTNA